MDLRLRNELRLAALQRECPGWQWHAERFGFGWHYIGHRHGRNVRVYPCAQLDVGDDERPSTVWYVDDGKGCMRYDVWKSDGGQMKCWVYVAGSSQELARVRAVQAALCAAGCAITHDWTQSVEAAGSGSPETVTPTDELEAWFADLRGVCAADIVVVLAPRAPATTIGAWVELGVAWGYGVPVVLVGNQPWGHRRVVARRVDDDAEVTFAVLGLAVEIALESGAGKRDV